MCIRAEVIMLQVFALFYSEFPVIFLHFAHSMHYSQDHCQNNLLHLEIIHTSLQCMTTPLEYYTNFNNVLIVLLKYINLFSMMAS